MSQSPKEILDCRLAKGEISISEYHTLLRSISPKTTIPNPQVPRTKIPVEGDFYFPTDQDPLSISGSLTLYDSYFQWKGRRYEYSDVTRLLFHAQTLSINFVPQKSAQLSVFRGDEQLLSLWSESRVLFTSKYRKAIVAAYETFRRKTYESRWNSYLESFRLRGYISVDGVQIFKNGDIAKGTKKVNLIQARRNGLLHYGSSYGNGNIYFSGENPYKVILKETKEFRSPKISFHLLSDRDVIMPILERLSIEK